MRSDWPSGVKCKLSVDRSNALLLPSGCMHRSSLGFCEILGHETELDRWIVNWKGQFLSRGQHKRGRFRRLHHLFSYLKYWDIYQQKFAYLDAKSQGLLAMSAILTTAFAVLIGGSSGDEKDNLHYFAVASSFAGMALLIGAQILLLRCFATTADKAFPKFEEEAIALEARVWHGGGDTYFGRTRTLESNLDYFLACHLEMIQEIGPQHERLKESLEKVWVEIRAKDEDSFASFEEAVSSFFGRLRDAVEDEVSKRHDHYDLARKLVFFTLFLLLFCVFVYSGVVL